MKLGLVGFPQVEKRTLFRLLTGKDPNPAVRRETCGDWPTSEMERFDRLVRFIRRAGNPCTDRILAPFRPGQEAARNEEILRSLEQVDVICHLVRTFQDEATFHLYGHVDPRRDILVSTRNCS